MVCHFCAYFKQKNLILLHTEREGKRENEGKVHNRFISKMKIITKTYNIKKRKRKRKNTM